MTAASGLTGEPDATGEPTAAGAGSALAEPWRRVGARWTVLVALANLALWMGYFAPLQVLLPQQAEAIDPTGKTTFLGWATAAGALVAVVANPLAGALSDRTAGRFGRRRPWALGGALLGAAGLVSLSGRTSLVGVVIGWCVAQAGLNLLQASITAVVPDQVPVTQRATVAGWLSVPQSLGVVVGVLVVTVLVTGNAAGYLVTAGLVVALTLPFALLAPDQQLLAAQRPRWSLAGFVGGFRAGGGRGPDFAWAFGTRFLVQFGNALAILYLLFYLRDEVRYEQTVGGKAEDGLLLVILIYTAAAVVSTVVGGMISDRSGRRKRSVTVSGLVTAVPAVLLALWPTWPVVLASALLLGIGSGAYLAVDQALVTQVLPTAADRARDLGIINIANSAPQVLAPVVAAPIVSSLGGYPALYLTVAAVTVLGSVLVHRIRTVP
jgi:MFS family permease